MVLHGFTNKIYIIISLQQTKHLKGKNKPKTKKLVSRYSCKDETRVQ